MLLFGEFELCNSFQSFQTQVYGTNPQLPTEVPDTPPAGTVSNKFMPTVMQSELTLAGTTEEATVAWSGKARP